MNTGQTIFAQVMKFLPLLDFRKCVERYHGNYKVKNFTCLDQYLCLAYANETRDWRISADDGKIISCTGTHYFEAVVQGTAADDFLKKPAQEIVGNPIAVVLVGLYPGHALLVHQQLITFGFVVHISGDIGITLSHD